MILVAISSLLLLLFFYFKIIRFQGLYYTFNDMYIFLQSSRSWINGRPLLYENVWGYSDRIHNNYLMLLWGPIIYICGAYGAFIVQTGLSIVSYSLMLRYLSHRARAWVGWLFLLVLLVGPIWFWFNDHPGIGWHPELTYLPLSILFILTLLIHECRWFWITAALMVLVKEDGALLAGSIHLAFLSIQYLHADRTRNIFGVLTQPRFWLVLGGWAIVFITGMAFLSYKNHAYEPEPRLQQALDVIAAGMRERRFILKNLKLLFLTALLLLPSVGMLLYGLYQVKWRQSRSVLLIYVIAQLALLLSNWVQGATYYGTNAFFDLVSLTWPPRFVLVYAFSFTYILAFWTLFGAGKTAILAWKPTVIGFCLLFIQLPIVQYVRPDFHLISIARTLLRHHIDPAKEPLLPSFDVAVIKKLAESIPAHSNVFVFDFLIPFFHKHYTIWPTENQWENADLSIIPNDDFQNLSEQLPRVMKHPYRSIQLHTYTIFFTPSFAPYINEALRPISQ